MSEESKDTQPMMKQILEEMRAGFARIEARLDAIEKRLTLIEIQIGNLHKQMGKIVAEHEDFDNRLLKLENPSKIN